MHCRGRSARSVAISRASIVECATPRSARGAGRGARPPPHAATERGPVAPFPGPSPKPRLPPACVATGSEPFVPSPGPACSCAGRASDRPRREVRERSLVHRHEGPPRAHPCDKKARRRPARGPEPPGRRPIEGPHLQRVRGPPSPLPRHASPPTSGPTAGRPLNLRPRRPLEELNRTGPVVRTRNPEDTLGYRLPIHAR